MRRKLPLYDDASESLRELFPLPVATSRSLHLPARADVSPRVLAILLEVRDALERGRPCVVATSGLAASDERELWDVLGEGEVSIVVAGAARYEITETALAGVYRVTTRSDSGETRHLEVGRVPAVVIAAAEQGTSADLPIEDPPPPGLMNAQPLLAELRHRMHAKNEDGPNHVVSLTLLPLNDADGAYLARALGAGPIAAESRGYGTCRVAVTARRGIWSVQYFNAMDHLILDTIEVGEVPASLVAAPMDLEDSAARLAELLHEAAS